MGSGSLLKLAFKKYGKSNFKKTILEIYLDFDKANEAEIRLIKEEKSKGKGEYNISGGGQSCSDPFLYKSEEDKKLIFEKESKNRKGKPSGNSGKRRINGRRSYNKKEQPCKRARRIKCLETGEIFSSIRECCFTLKISHTALKDFLNGKRKIPIGGYTFEEIKERKTFIVIVENGLEFETVMDCAKYLNCSRSSIMRHLSGKTKSCKGYHINKKRATV